MEVSFSMPTSSSRLTAPSSSRWLPCIPRLSTNRRMTETCECQQAIFAGDSTIHAGVLFVNVGIESSSIAHERLFFLSSFIVQ